MKRVDGNLVLHRKVLKNKIIDGSDLIVKVDTSGQEDKDDSSRLDKVD